MTRFIRIALIVLCVISCVGTAFAVSSAAQLPTDTGIDSLCNQPCLSSGDFCTSASDCPSIRGFTKACCFNTCVYCP